MSFLDYMAVLFQETSILFSTVAELIQFEQCSTSPSAFLFFIFISVEFWEDLMSLLPWTFKYWDYRLEIYTCLVCVTDLSSSTMITRGEWYLIVIYVSTYMWRPDWCQLSPTDTFYLIFRDRVSHRTWSLLIQLG